MEAVLTDHEISIAAPTITDLLHREEKSLARFRRALRDEDKVSFDDMFTAAYIHRSAAAYAKHLLPFETFLLCMNLVDHKEMMRLRTELLTIQEQKVSLLSKLMENHEEVMRLRSELQILREQIGRLLPHETQ